MDSRDSSHMKNNLNILSDLKHYSKYDKIIVMNVSQLAITYVENTIKSTLKLQEVLGLRLLRIYSQLVNLR